MPAIGPVPTVEIVLLELGGADRDVPPSVDVELPLEPGVVDAIERARSVDGAGPAPIVGVLVPAIPDGDEAVAGEVIGLLTAAVLAGATVIRTHDVRRARRVVAVVAALTAGSMTGARMEL